MFVRIAQVYVCKHSTCVCLHTQYMCMFASTEHIYVCKHNTCVFASTVHVYVCKHSICVCLQTQYMCMFVITVHVYIRRPCMYKCLPFLHISQPLSVYFRLTMTEHSPAATTRNHPLIFCFIFIFIFSFF